MDQADAKLQFAQQNYERVSRLSENGGGISAKELEQSRSEFLTLKKELAASNASLEKLQQTKALRLQMATLRVNAQKTEIDRLVDSLSKHTIRAPFEGVVVRKMVDVGDWLTRGTPIMEIVEMDPIELTIQVPQSYLPSLQSLFSNRADQPIDVSVAVDGFGENFVGQVRAIVPQADLRTRSLPVVIRVKNELTKSGYRLNPGMLAHAKLAVGKPKKVITVKKDALVLGNQTSKLILARKTIWVVWLPLQLKSTMRTSARRLAIWSKSKKGSLRAIKSSSKETNGFDLVKNSEL